MGRSIIYQPGMRVGHYMILTRTSEVHGNGNAVFIVRCTLCRRKYKKTLHKMKHDHAACWRFARETPSKKPDPKNALKA